MIGLDSSVGYQWIGVGFFVGGAPRAWLFLDFSRTRFWPPYLGFYPLHLMLVYLLQCYAI